MGVILRGRFLSVLTCTLIAASVQTPGIETPPAALPPSAYSVLTAPENLPPRPSTNPDWRRMTSFGADTESSCNKLTRTLSCFVDAYFACIAQRAPSVCETIGLSPEPAPPTPHILDFRIIAIGPPWNRSGATFTQTASDFSKSAVAVDVRDCTVMDSRDVQGYEEAGGWLFFLPVDADGNRWACQDGIVPYYLYLHYADGRWMPRPRGAALAHDEYPPRPQGKGWRRLSYFGVGDTDCLNKRHTRRCALETYIYRQFLLFDELYKFEHIIDYRLVSLKPYRVRDLPERWRPSGRRDLREKLRGIAPHPSEVRKDARLATFLVRWCHRKKGEATIICGKTYTSRAIIASDGFGILDGTRINYWQVEWFED